MRLWRHRIALGASIQLHRGPCLGLECAMGRQWGRGAGRGRRGITSSGSGYSTSDGQQQQPPTICHRIQGDGVTPTAEEPGPPQDPPPR